MELSLEGQEIYRISYPGKPILIHRLVMRKATLQPSIKYF